MWINKPNFTQSNKKSTDDISSALKDLWACTKKELCSLKGETTIWGTTFSTEINRKEKNHISATISASNDVWKIDIRWNDKKATIHAKIPLWIVKSSINYDPLIDKWSYEFAMWFPNVDIKIVDTLLEVSWKVKQIVIKVTRESWKNKLSMKANSHSLEWDQKSIKYSYHPKNNEELDINLNEHTLSWKYKTQLQLPWFNKADLSVNYNSNSGIHTNFQAEKIISLSKNWHLSITANTNDPKYDNKAYIEAQLVLEL